jgi:hypothetical protein
LQTSKLILDFEFGQHLESHKHVISIIMGFRDTGCYSPNQYVDLLDHSLQCWILAMIYIHMRENSNM